MNIATETTMRELRILWVSSLDGALRMTWVEESPAARTLMEVLRCGR
jgi:hypothetical protein